MNGFQWLIIMAPFPRQYLPQWSVLNFIFRSTSLNIVVESWRRLPSILSPFPTKSPQSKYWEQERNIQHREHEPCVLVFYPRAQRNPVLMSVISFNRKREGEGRRLTHRTRWALKRFAGTCWESLRSLRFGVYNTAPNLVVIPVFRPKIEKRWKGHGSENSHQCNKHKQQS